MNTPLTPRDEELLAMPTIMSHFPLVMANKMEWREFSGKCLCCSKLIDNGNLRGHVSHPIPSVAVVEAVGVCPNCSLLTRFFYRLHDDARLSGPRDGGWQNWQGKPSFYARMQSFLKKIFYAFKSP